MIQEIIATQGLDFAMRYWLLLEYLCEEFKEDSTEFNISTSVFSSRIYIKHIKKLESFAQILTEISEKFDGNSIEIQKVSNNFWKIKTDILLKLMSRDYKKARNNRATTALKKENKKKNKKENNKKIQKKENSAPSSGLDNLDNFDRDKILTLPDGHEILAEIWNDVASELNLSKVTTPLSEKRVKLCKAAIKSMPSLERWKMAFSGIASSDFHLGKNDREWKASFDWLIQSTKENYLRMAEKGEEINAAQN